MNAVLCIDVGGTKIRAGLMSEVGKIRCLKEIPTCAERGGAYILKQIIQLVHEYQFYNIKAVGIGTAGQIGLEGEIISSTKAIPNWTGICLEREVFNATGIKTQVINDVQAMALGELSFGEGKQFQNFLCLALGTGVGGAVIINGDLYRGTNGCGGELGHIVIKAGGRECPCGKRGCLESYVSGNALSKRYEEKLGVETSSYQFFKDLNQHKTEAKELFSDYIEELSYGISSLVSAFNPQCIILGGGVADELEAYSCEIVKQLKYFINPAIWNEDLISFSSLKGNAMLLGAGSLVYKNEIKG